MDNRTVSGIYTHEMYFSGMRSHGGGGGQLAGDLIPGQAHLNPNLVRRFLQHVLFATVSHKGKKCQMQHVATAETIQSWDQVWGGGFAKRIFIMANLVF